MPMRPKRRRATTTEDGGKRPKSAGPRARTTDADKSAPDIVNDARWTQGDFEVITSDNIRFLVPSYMLYSQSPVFRDAQALGVHPTALHPKDPADPSEMPIAQTVTLLDETFETARVFRRFLAHISSATVTNLGNFWMPDVLDLVAFLRKWDCDVALQHLILLVSKAARDKRVSSLRALCVAACAEDDNACVDILTYCLFREMKDDADSIGTGTNAMYSANTLDPAVWGVLWGEVPIAYLLALAHTFNENQSDLSDDEPPGKPYADAFLIWLARTKGAAPTHVGCKKLPKPTGIVPRRQADDSSDEEDDATDNQAAAAAPATT